MNLSCQKIDRTTIAKYTQWWKGKKDAKEKPGRKKRMDTEEEEAKSENKNDEEALQVMPEKKRKKVGKNQSNMSQQGQPLSSRQLAESQNKNSSDFFNFNEL